MYISARERKILEQLLRTQSAITVKEIADKLDVSQRTVHRDLNGVEKIISEFQLELHKKAGVGFRIYGNKEDIKRLSEELGKISAVEFSPDERKMIILSALLESDGPVKLIAMANELHVTTATVSNDLDQLEEEIRSNKLSLIRKRGYGVEIIGEETNKRAALANLISYFLDPFDYISQAKENIWKQNKDTTNTISNRLLGLVNPKSLDVIEQTIQKLKKQLPHDLADSSYIGLVVHIALALERLQKGDNITFDRSYLSRLKDTPEYRIAGKIIRELENSFHMRIPEDEIGYITMHLLGAKLRVGKDFLLEDTSLDTAYRAKELIDFVGGKMKLDLSGNNSLLTDLVAHLKPVIFRLAQGMRIKNPMSMEIKKDYEELFDLTHEGVKKVFPDMDFPEDEIAYLVLHFATAIMYAESENGLRALVLCSSGIGSAKMLATRLKQRIPEIQEVINRSMLDIDNIDNKAYDLIVSTVPLKDLEANEYILVSPMLNKHEEHKVKKAVRRRLISNPLRRKTQHDGQKRENQHFLKLQELQQSMQVLVDILDDFTISSLQNDQNVTAVLTQICVILEDRGKIKNQSTVLEKLLQREKMGGLGIPESGMALFHTRSADVPKASFDIFDLEKPLRIQGMDGCSMDAKRLLIMLAPKEADKKELETVSFLSGAIIQNQASMKLFEFGEQEKIKGYLSEQFYRGINWE